MNHSIIVQLAESSNATGVIGGMGLGAPLAGPQVLR
jgi:hypothetical protein